MEPCGRLVATVLPCLILCTVLGLLLGSVSVSVAHLRLLLGAASDSVVVFPDHNIEAAVREALGKPTGDITTEDMGQLTSLSAVGRGVRNLTGLEHATNLQNLSLEVNRVSNLSPLAGLTNLRTLGLEGNQVSDLCPLSGLANLQNLYLSYNQVSDLSSLSGLTNLQNLSLKRNQVSDLSPLSGLTNLQNLFLWENEVSDISPLSGLTNLQNLYLAENQVSDLSPLASLTNLQCLRLFRNQVSDLSPLAGLANLRTLDLESNQVSDLSPLSGLANLKQLGLSANEVSDLSPLSGLTNLQNLYLIQNQVSDLSALSGLTNLQNLYLSINQVSDLSPLAGLTTLRGLFLDENQVSDISALVANSQAGGIGTGDTVNLASNYLDLSAGSKAMTDIQTLIVNGATVWYSPQQPPPVHGRIAVYIRDQLNRTGNFNLDGDNRTTHYNVTMVIEPPASITNTSTATVEWIDPAGNILWRDSGIPVYYDPQCGWVAQRIVTANKSFTPYNCTYLYHVRVTVGPHVDQTAFYVRPNPRTVRINEVEQNPTGEDGGKEWVELFNWETDSVDLTGWQLIASHGNEVAVSLSGILTPRGYAVVTYMSESLDNEGEVVILRNQAGCEIDHTPPLNDTANDDMCWARYPNGEWTWSFQPSTKGVTNGEPAKPIPEGLVGLGLVIPSLVHKVVERLAIWK